MAEQTPELQFYYWPLRGLGHPLINLLELTGIPHKVNLLAKDPVAYENIHVKKFADAKVHFSNLPYIEHGGTLLTETDAIACHIANAAGKPELFITKDNALRFLQLSGVIKDLAQAITTIVFDCKDLDELRERYQAKAAARYGRKAAELDDYLTDKKFLLGDQVTYLDLLFAEYVEKTIAMEKDLGVEINSNKENFVRVMNNVYEIPQIKAYRGPTSMDLLVVSGTAGSLSGSNSVASVRADWSLPLPRVRIDRKT